MVRAMAPKYRLDPNLVFAVIEAESGFNSKALSSENAQGLMQLIPATAECFGVQDVWDPEQNLKGGMAYLRWLLDHFDGNVELALAGYNAGERAWNAIRASPPPTRRPRPMSSASSNASAVKTAGRLSGCPFTAWLSAIQGDQSTRGSIVRRSMGSPPGIIR